ncbi:glycosyltransferase [Parabacteroides sp. OttesenSCG-928-G06]|nr:glycosyltransferase [Parabacteroides sp. OttesenSCG-928-G06]
MKKHIHVIAFNIPYPANYGGVIDVFYKVKALYDMGVGVILHCFEYGREHAAELEALCEKVYYYKRRTGLLANLSLLPYNVNSRRDPQLLAHLLEDDYPILFEGLHTCYYINEPRLRNRIKIYRESNIEHDYYRMLAKATSKKIEKLFFTIESARFRRYEKVLRHANLMLVVSTTDTMQLRERFPDSRVVHMPSFHPNEQLTVQPGKSDFILYHGNLSVAENELAALYLIDNVFSRTQKQCVIAGMDPSPRLILAAARYANVNIVASPSADDMDKLIGEAQVQLLITFQDTGLKLKLLNSLFQGRFVVVNKLMLSGSELDHLCVVADTPEEMVAACERLMKIPMTEEVIERRRSVLFPAYSNRHQAERLLQLVFN